MGLDIEETLIVSATLSKHLMIEICVDFVNSKCTKGFPDISVGKESACNAGDPVSIPGSGRSAGEGIGCPLQDSGLSSWLSW